MSFTQKLLRSFVDIYPRISTLASKVQSKHKFICNYPLLLQETTSKRHAFVSQKTIKKGNILFLIDFSECIFSTNFVGANLVQQSQMKDKMQKLTQNYESMSQDFMERVRIIIQMMANNQTLNTGQMPLTQYSQYILGSQDTSLPKSQMNSRFLLDLCHVWQRSNKVAFSNLKKQFLKRTEQQQFLSACNKGKNVIRDTGRSTFKYAIPFIDKIDHSFDPSCQFQILYLPHRRSFFVRIETIKDIEAGQRPTINYGNLNNYQLLLRYGFVVQNNPNKFFMLPLNFQQIVQAFNKNIDWKQNLFVKNKLKLRNYVKILPKGELSQQEMLMMRILINDNQNPNEKDIYSQKFDKLIYKFINSHVKTFRKHIKINSLKVSQNKHIRILQDQQISILQEFIKIHDKQ